MNTTERRQEILDILRQTDSPIAAKELAARFHVSRQVIVQDLAVIRASHTGIVSTYRGYILQQESGCTREFKVRHGLEQTADELNIIVDCGGRVQNVSISHRVYGRITAELDIRSRQDVQEFMDTLCGSESTLLGSATSGYHYHLVEAAGEERLDLIEEKLKECGLLAPLSAWEKETC
ncbi:MAG: transcription repressor NadR [Acutalibacteraceae bacterium]